MEKAIRKGIGTKWLSRLLLALSTAALLSAALLTNKQYQLAVEMQESARENAEAQTRRVAAEVDQSLQKLMPLAQAVARRILAESWSEPQLQAEFERILRGNPDIFGVGVAFEPFAFDPKRRLYAPYLLRRNGQTRWAAVDEEYDYTEPDYTWYGDSLDRPPHWNEPYYGQVSQTALLEYVVPIIDPADQKTPRGLVFISYAQDTVQRHVESLDLGQDGYAFIASRHGRLIAHPIAESVRAGENLFDLAERGNKPRLAAAARRAQTGERGEIEYVSELTGRSSWLYYEPIQASGWSLFTVFEKKDAVVDDEGLRQRQLLVILSWTVFLVLFLLTLFAYATTGNTLGYWVLAFMISVTFMGGIALVWRSDMTSSIGDNPDVGLEIVNKAALNAFVKDNTRQSLLTGNGHIPRYIPTGVFVQSLEFNNSNEVVLTGYLWQRYHDDYHQGLSRGVIFPEAAAVEMEPAYERRSGRETIAGSHFKVTLRQHFDYSRYPFDEQSVWIRLWHQDIERNVILIPDLDAYDRVNPEWLPGVAKDLVLKGWHLTRSFFDYRRNSYNADFGFERTRRLHEVPELYFDVGLKRNFIDPFISKLAPIVVVFLMLFSILITSSSKSDRVELLGFNASAIVASCSALFFVVLVSHIDIRSSLEAKELIYLEYFYFLAYLAILFVTVNSIIFTWGIPIRFIQYKDNLLPKLYYWPVINALAFAVTVLAFYD